MRILLIVLLVALSGCASDLETAHLAIAGGDLDIDEERHYDPEARPTAPLYEAEGRSHPGVYSLHDLLHEWAQETDHELETQFYDGDFGYGFTLCAIDDFPPAQHQGEERGCFERGGYWAVSVDGEAADVGMSDIGVEDGETFQLTWTPIDSS